MALRLPMSRKRKLLLKRAWHMGFLFVAWIFLGFFYYSYVAKLGPSKGIFMAINIGYAVGVSYPVDREDDYVFSIFYILCGQSLVAMALGFFTEKIGEDHDNWFTNMIQKRQYERAFQRGTTFRTKVRAARIYYKAILRAICVFIACYIALAIYGFFQTPHITKDNPLIAIYFALSFMSTGGFLGLEENDKDVYYLQMGILMMIGVPIMTMAMVEISQVFVRKGDLKQTRALIEEEFSIEELIMMQKFGLEDGDGVIDRSEFIILCMVRMGTDPNLIKFISRRFSDLDDDNSGTLSISEITCGKYDFIDGKIFLIDEEGEIVHEIHNDYDDIFADEKKTETDDNIEEDKAEDDVFGTDDDDFIVSDAELKALEERCGVMGNQPMSKNGMKYSVIHGRKVPRYSIGEHLMVTGIMNEGIEGGPGGFTRPGGSNFERQRKNRMSIAQFRKSKVENPRMSIANFQRTQRGRRNNAMSMSIAQYQKTKKNKLGSQMKDDFTMPNLNLSSGQNEEDTNIDSRNNALHTSPKVTFERTRNYGNKLGNIAEVSSSFHVSENRQSALGLRDSSLQRYNSVDALDKVKNQMRSSQVKISKAKKNNQDSEKLLSTLDKLGNINNGSKWMKNFKNNVISDSFWDILSEEEDAESDSDSDSDENSVASGVVGRFIHRAFKKGAVEDDEANSDSDSNDGSAASNAVGRFNFPFNIGNQFRLKALAKIGKKSTEDNDDEANSDSDSNDGSVASNAVGRFNFPLNIGNQFRLKALAKIGKKSAEDNDCVKSGGVAPFDANEGDKKYDVENIESGKSIRSISNKFLSSRFNSSKNLESKKSRIIEKKNSTRKVKRLLSSGSSADCVDVESQSPNKDDKIIKIKNSNTTLKPILNTDEMKETETSDSNINDNQNRQISRNQEHLDHDNMSKRSSQGTPGSDQKSKDIRSSEADMLIASSTYNKFIVNDQKSDLRDDTEK